MAWHGSHDMVWWMLFYSALMLAFWGAIIYGVVWVTRDRGDRAASRAEVAGIVDHPDASGKGGKAENESRGRVIA